MPRASPQKRLSAGTRPVRHPEAPSSRRLTTLRHSTPSGVHNVARTPISRRDRSAYRLAAGARQCGCSFSPQHGDHRDVRALEKYARSARFRCTRGVSSRDVAASRQRRAPRLLGRRGAPRTAASRFEARVAIIVGRFQGLAHWFVPPIERCRCRRLLERPAPPKHQRPALRRHGSAKPRTLSRPPRTASPSKPAGAHDHRRSTGIGPPTASLGDH